MFSIRNYLREREALLVHFSSPLRECRSLTFPDDLQKAIELEEKVLCFSTILATDVGPAQDNCNQNKANSTGSVGIIVNIPENNSVVAVDNSDCGSYVDKNTGERKHCGSSPTKSACEKSIDKREGYNEWLVKNYSVVAIFTFKPIRVWKECQIGDDSEYGEVTICFSELLETFPNQIIISVRDGMFIEYNKIKETWNTVKYSDIL